MAINGKFVSKTPDILDGQVVVFTFYYLRPDWTDPTKNTAILFLLYSPWAMSSTYVVDICISDEISGCY